MNKTKIFDTHAHIFPEKIAVKASMNVGVFYDIPMGFDGRVQTLLNLGEKHHIDKFLVQSVATVPEQVESINTFIGGITEKYPDIFIGFATLHPGYKDIEKEVQRAISLGLLGIKIHPDFQRFNIDGKEAFKIYEVIEGRLPILIHTGDFRSQFSKPNRVCKLVKKFPKLDIIGAHFGGWSEWNEAARVLEGTGIYVDTSSSLYALSPENARELIDLYGIDKVLFGSDFPMWDPGDELEHIKKIHLTHEEYEKIMYKNAESLLKINI